MFETAGCDPQGAKYGAVLVHGRGSDGSEMRPVFSSLYLRSTYALFPNGPFEIMKGNRLAWYTHFWNTDPEESLPEISHSFNIIDQCIDELIRNNIPENHITLLGHSQGANLLLEYVADNPRPFNAIVAMRGCFLGQLEQDRTIKSNLNGLRFIINSGRNDPYIPSKKSEQACEILSNSGAEVLHKHYETGHGVCQAELNDIRKLFHKNFDFAIFEE